MTRDEKMQKRREAGKVYTYKKNPYEKGTKAWLEEENARAEKRKSSKLHHAKITSVFAKLNYRLEKKKEMLAKKKQKKSKEKK